jgi:hypothetical protein
MKSSTARNLAQFTRTFLTPYPPAVQISRTNISHGIRKMSSSDLNIENTSIKTASGVDLTSQQKTLVGSVLDLFAGRPSLEKLRLWSDEAVFEDPLTIARGRKQFEPQWVRAAL